MQNLSDQPFPANPGIVDPPELDPDYGELVNKLFRGCGMRAVDPDRLVQDLYGCRLTEITSDQLDEVGTLLVSGRPIPTVEAREARFARATMLAEERAARMRRALETIQADAVEIITHVQTDGVVHRAARQIVRTAGEAIEVAS